VLDSLNDYDNVILFVIDGLGFEYVQASKGLFKNQCRARLTSVFPSTTAASITTFLTGQAPQQHGLTGWFTYLQEVGGVTAVLPCMLRGKQNSISELGIDIASLYNHPSFFSELECDSHIVSPGWILETEFNQCHTGKAQTWGYDGMEDMFAQMQQCIRTARDKQYIYTYWSEFDHLSHLNGNRSDIVTEHYRQLQTATEKFISEIHGTNTLLLITADHGFIDTEPERCITINDHPRLHDCLSMPLSGEPRAAYCYLKEGKQDFFLDYVNSYFAKQLDCIPSKQLLDDSWFGLGQPHPQLDKRIGDYTLLLKENYIVKDWLESEKRFFHYGVHGGVSESEMFVPLIVIPA
jgi:predicted AlkP superfamily pyrophosphatase or phosphodiesterase